MPCQRCGTDSRAGRWCGPCEALFDQWVRRHAADIVWAVLSGGLVLATVGMVLPLLGIGAGVGWGMGASAAALGWGTLLSSYKLIQRHRRRQFLSGAEVPRAYLLH